MFAFLARTFLLLGAAFVIGALGGRATRGEGRRSPPKRRAETTPAGHSEADAAKGAVRSSGAVTPLAAEAGGETLSESADPVPSTLSHQSTASSGGGSASGKDRPAEEAGQAPAAVLPSFASYGGSGVVAGVVHEDGRAGVEDSAAEPALSPATPLAAPDVHGRTASGSDRAALPEDPLARRHETDTLDFKSVDYGNRKAAERTAAEEAFRDDGWTVPEGRDGPLESFPAESPAAFKSGGGAGAVHGAPDTGTAEGSDASAADAAGADAVGADGQTDAPASLPAARGGVPDDLTRISGIGPSIERLLFDNGIFHFDQIAAWTEREARWADALSGFRGRVERENWIGQASLFAAETSDG